MSLEFLNPALLFGLAALALPIVAHLLSKKRFDVVQWGAMQFLDLGKRRRRRVRIEELLLLLLRMAIVGLLALAIARPTVSGGFFANFVSTDNRDMVFVMDGSYSMGRSDGETTPHNQAQAVIHKLLNHARPGDTFALLDARDQTRFVSDGPLRDANQLRTLIDALPPPAGASNLAAAVADALQILGTTSHVRRDVVVLTDGQAHGWHLTEAAQWQVIDELRSQPAVQPLLWVVNFQAADTPSNFSLDRLDTSRARAPVGFPVRVSTTLRYTSEDGPGECNLYFEVDGQRLGDATVKSPLLEPGGEFRVEFEHRFSTAGSHVLSVVLDDDAVPGDNRVDVAIAATQPLRVILVDGTPHLDPTRSETFFAEAALRSDAEQAPFVDSRVVTSQNLNLSAIDQADVIVLANVATFSAEQAEMLRQFVEAGGGLLIAPGRLVEPENYRTLLGDLLPGDLTAFVEPEEAANVDVAQLQLPWQIGAAAIDELATARFSGHWKMTPHEQAHVPVRFVSGDALLLSSPVGRGRVMLLSTPLDDDGSNLPTKSVYVALLHEMLFYLAAAEEFSLNVNVGEPLLQPLIDEAAEAEIRVTRPDGTTATPEIGGEPPLIRYDDTSAPGVYELEQPRRNRSGRDSSVATRFVVNFDRGERDLTPLSVTEIEELSADGRITFVDLPDDLETQLLTDDSRTELWQLLVVLVFALLCLEIWMTRRLVQGGHAVLDAAASTGPHPPHSND
ncbi:BatA domain-containing protein [Symmachiella dynata]|uniref:BatA domain-containing protein n=1 Tax=Symmachiella dynata TaxID=2527995 RepID=UPI0030EB3599